MFIVCTFFIDTVIPTQQMNKLRLTDTHTQAKGQSGFGARSAMHCPLCIALDHDTLGVYLGLISAEVSARPLRSYYQTSCPILLGESKYQGLGAGTNGHSHTPDKVVGIPVSL